MIINFSLTLIWLILCFFHIIPMFTYIIILYFISEKRKWNIKINDKYLPTISLLIPTYQEARVIKEKLDNLKQIKYPKENLEIIVIDSASNDGTFEIASKWIENNPDLKITLLKENERSGKAHALNKALHYAKGEVICISDAEALLAPNSLINSVKYLADDTVGAVTGVHEIFGKKRSNVIKIEKTYRNIYKYLSIGESKLHSTPIFEGELALYKRELISRFPEDVGADDVAAALSIIKKGFRAIAVADSVFYEPTPYTWKERFKQKIRRGQHLIQAFLKYRSLIFKENTVFHNLIFPMRIYMYIINPIIASFLFIVTIPIIIKYYYLIFLSLLMIIPRIREITITHITNTIIMLLALLKEIKGEKQIIWKKIDETR